MRLRFNIILFFSLLLISSSSKNPKDCQLKIVDQGISVFTCKRNDSDLNSIKATFNSKISPLKYAEIIMDIEHYPEWNQELRGVRVLEKISINKLVYYFEIDAPWPIKDRFGVLSININQNLETGEMTIIQNLEPELMNKKAGLVGIKEYTSILRIVPIEKRINKAELNMIIDPGNNIPAWLINLVTVRIPVNTYTSIFERAEDLNDQATKQHHND
jgi:hypothetical protein